MPSIFKMGDILEYTINSDVMDILLKDMTTNKNIIWATDDYSNLGDGYSFTSELTKESIVDGNGVIIKPRVEKDRASQTQRSREKAEVFTPSWVCNEQNNLIDDAWFGKHIDRFNKEKGTTWKSTYARGKEGDIRDRIKFPKGKTWVDYVKANRMEISCGEAPYLTSRYDTVTGKYIRTKSRIGLLDRKLRVITENTENEKDWLFYAELALKSIYGFEWQGDNILLARENVLLTVVEHFVDKFNALPDKMVIEGMAQIIAWNIWQMDGIKCVIPQSCHYEEVDKGISLLDDMEEQTPVFRECQGCRKGDIDRHNGIYARIMDWETNEPIEYRTLLKGVQQNAVK